MTLPNVPATPPLWSDADLAREAQISLDAFRERRLREPNTRYAELLRREKLAVRKLIRLLAHVDPDNPDPGVLLSLMTDDSAFDALRYAAGPPVSMDDLSVLVMANTDRLTRARLAKDEKLAALTLATVCQLIDGNRFPWVAARRPARFAEIKRAVYATASLHASQLLQTERRGYGREVEKTLAKALLEIGFERVAAGNGGKLMRPNQLPKPRRFFGETTLMGRKTDLLIGLSDGRSVAVEAKDSASVINSVKRVLNDTAAKAKHWRDKFGETVIPVALLSGVFGVHHLKSAQAAGLYLVWAHDLAGFVDWLDAS